MHDDLSLREEKYEILMVTGDFQGQYVLRSYCGQLVYEFRVSIVKVENKTTQNDEIALSPESKRRLLAEKITREIITQFSNGSEMTPTGRYVLEQLSQEYRQPLQLSYSDIHGMFLVVPDETDQGSRILSRSENEDLNKKLFEIT